MDAIEKDALIQRTMRIAREAVTERHRAAVKGYDLQHDLGHGGMVHCMVWASDWIEQSMADDTEATPEDRRRALVKAAGLLLAAIDAHDYQQMSDQDAMIERGG